jgi:hypothetical protein
MRWTVKASIAVIGAVLGFGGVAEGQAPPTATTSGPVFNPGPTLPAIDGTFQWAASGSELIQTGFYAGGGTTSSLNLSGNAEYISKSSTHPFSMLYGGGVLLQTSSGSSNQFYQNFTISQGLVKSGWALGVSDSVSFLPQSPTTGLSGVPGTGDLGLQPAPDPNVPPQTVLTYYGKRLSNSANGSIERQINPRTSVSGSGNYGILRFIGEGSGNSAGLDTTNISGQVGLNRRFSPRSSGSVSGYYSDYSYNGNQSSFHSSGANLVFSRQMSKTLTMSLSAGPQFVSGFQAYPVEGTTVSTAVPSSVNVAVNASLGYTRGPISGLLAYSRGVNGGSGVQTGAFSDNVTVGAQHTYRRDWSVGLTGTFTRTTGLPTVGSTETVYGGFQVSRRLSPALSLFAGYTGIHQSTAASLAGTNAFSGFSQSGSIGVTYSPRSTRLGQF